ncbi:glycosyltransferase family 4 protein [Candidatus Woesebacteria bacterium]|nr:glycosyltransferase family 4 protein [Candidatus Woesebacteria bacterium]
MTIGVDAGCLGIADFRSKTGIYRMAENLLRNLPDTGDRFILYSFYPIAKDSMWSFGERFKNKVIPWKKGWLDFVIPVASMVHGIDLFWALNQAIPFILAKKKLVFVHDLAYKFHPKFYSAKMQRRSAYAINHADHIVTFADASKKDIEKFYLVSPSKISVCYQGYADELFFPASRKKLSIVATKYNLKKPYFLFVGSLKPIKNVAGIVNAFYGFDKHWSGFELIMVGNDANWQASQVNNYPGIRYLGFVPDEDLPALYSGAQAFLHPSLYEGFGQPVIEAMACGCPAIVSNRGSLPELTGESAIIVNPEKPKEIVAALNSIAKDKLLRDKLSTRGLGQVRRFSWKTFAGAIMAISNKMNQ